MDESFTELAGVLEQGLRTRAERRGWSPTPNPSLLRGETNVGFDALVATVQGARAGTPSSERLPNFRRALDLLPASLSLLLCGLDLAEPEESYRAALWWTGLVRSDIAPSVRSDLHLFLIGPRGTNDDADWQGRRSRIESDERFCRKFVWLPSGKPNQVEVGAFLDRTFLAQPWEGEAAEPRSLDPLETLVEDAHKDSLLTPEEARLWIARLGAADSTGNQLAEDLVAVLEGKR